jgi:hypothetical protein
MICGAEEEEPAHALDGSHLAQQVADLAELCQGSHRGDLPFASQDVVRQVLHGAGLRAVLLERRFDHLNTYGSQMVMLFSCLRRLFGQGKVK